MPLCCSLLRVGEQVGSHALISVPLLGADPASARLVELEDGVEVWAAARRGATARQPRWLLARAEMRSSGGEAVVQLETTAGEFHFRVLA